MANYLGQAWVAVMGLAFVPLYIKYLGIDAYGLIGLYVVLQACLGLLDMGMTPMLSREMSRFTGGAYSGKHIRDVLRSVEIVAFLVAIVIAIGVVISANWLAKILVHSSNLSENVVTNAFFIMGLVIAMRFLEGIYRSAVIGLQRQVLFNLLNSFTATLRWGGAALIIAFISPTIEAFFLWQAFASSISVLVLMAATYKSLPAGDPGHFSINVIKSVRGFAGGMFLISITVLILTSLDKLVLSSLISLSEFGYYTLVVTAMSGLTYLSSPIIQAILPKLSELHAKGRHDSFSNHFHLAAQLVTIILGPAAWIAIFFPEALLDLWTGNPEVVLHASDLLRLMAFGSLLNGMMGIPYVAQLAVGWTRLTIITNISAILFLMPALFLFVPIYGVYGAAAVWICLNVGYFFISTHFIYKRILPGEKCDWYIQDVFKPLLASAISIGAIRFFYVSGSSKLESLLLILTAFLLGICVSTLFANRIRHKLRLFSIGYWDIFLKDWVNK